MILQRSINGLLRLQPIATDHQTPVFRHSWMKDYWIHTSYGGSAVARITWVGGISRMTILLGSCMRRTGWVEAPSSVRNRNRNRKWTSEVDRRGATRRTYRTAGTLITVLISPKATTSELCCFLETRRMECSKLSAPPSYTCK